MSDYGFKSKLGPYMDAALQERERNGYSNEYMVSAFRSFDSFIVENDLDDGKLSEALVVLWSIQRPTENLNTRNKRVGVAKMIAEYMMTLGIDVYIPKVVGSVEYSKPYLPTREELKVFFHTIDTEQPPKGHPIHPHYGYPVMFRMYYCLGLRLNEAVMMKRSDVSFETGTVYISHSKGDKDRIVYVSDDLLELMKRYDEKIDVLFPDREWFFPGKNHAMHFEKTSICRKFIQLWYSAFPDWKGKHPTTHCLRHCYVVHTVNNWVEAGHDAEELFPYLSKALGHSSIQETMYYYHMMDTETGAMDRFIKTPSILIGDKEEWV